MADKSADIVGYYFRLAPGAFDDSLLLLKVKKILPKFEIIRVVEAFARIDTEEIDPIFSITTEAA